MNDLIQTLTASITTQDLVTIGFLIFLEGVLSIDNALVLAMLARDLRPEEQKRALTYGLVGAIVFRLASLSMVTYLMQWVWIKFLGGGYLIFISLKHFLSKDPDDGAPEKPKTYAGFWKTVLLIELTDIAFAVDSILAAVAVTKKLWVVFAGGVIGVILMRFAATQFLKLLDRFPRFENTAYQLVLLVGTKLVIEGFEFPGIDFHDSSHWAFWSFWILLTALIAAGFAPTRDKK
jgi:YkoY family integral membrane protein